MKMRLALLCLSVILMSMMLACEAKKAGPQGTGILGTVSLYQFSPDEPEEVQIEAFAKIARHKIKDLKPDEKAARAYRGVTGVRVFEAGRPAVDVPFGVARDDLLGCDRGQTASLKIGAEAFRREDFSQPSRRLTLAVTGTDFRAPHIQWMPPDAVQADWLLGQARRVLPEAFRKLPDEEKAQFQCRKEKDCGAVTAHFRNLARPESIQPVFVEFVRLPGMPGVYALGSYRYRYEDGDETSTDTMMPTGFLAARFEAGKAPELVYHDVMTTGESVEGVAFLDLTGDERPELILSRHGYEWYWYDIFQIKDHSFRRLWAGGGGGC